MFRRCLRRENHESTREDWVKLWCEGWVEQRGADDLATAREIAPHWEDLLIPVYEVLRSDYPKVRDAIGKVAKILVQKGRLQGAELIDLLSKFIQYV